MTQRTSPPPNWNGSRTPCCNMAVGCPSKFSTVMSPGCGPRKRLKRGVGEWSLAGAAAGIFLAGSLTFYLIRNWARASDAVQAASAIGDLLELW